MPRVMMKIACTYSVQVNRAAAAMSITRAPAARFGTGAAHVAAM